MFAVREDALHRPRLDQGPVAGRVPFVIRDAGGEAAGHPGPVPDRDTGRRDLLADLSGPRGAPFVDVLAVDRAADRREEGLAEVQRIEDGDPGELALERAGLQVRGGAPGRGGAEMREVNGPDRGVHRLQDALSELPL